MEIICLVCLILYWSLLFKVDGLRGVVSIHRSSDYGPDGLPLPYPVLIIIFILEGHVVPSHII